MKTGKENNMNKLAAWARTWSRSQLTFTAVLAAALLALSIWVASKHNEMANIAKFWKQQYEQKP